MRRQKKKWRQKLDLQGASSHQGTGLEDSDSEFFENGVGIGGRSVGGQNLKGVRGVNEEGLQDFAPEGMSEKMRTRDLRQVAAMRRLASGKRAASNDATNAQRAGVVGAGSAADSLDQTKKQALSRNIQRRVETAPDQGKGEREMASRGTAVWEWPEEQKALDMLDQQAIKELQGQVDKYRARVIEVRGAGSAGVNGRYVREGGGDLQHIGLAYRRSRDPKSPLFNYVLLHEEASNEFEDGRSVEKDRWLLFNDALGVPGTQPYYEALGSWEAGIRSRSRWRCVQGEAPAPSLKRVLALEDEEDEEDSGKGSDVGMEDSADDDGLPLPPPLKAQGVAVAHRRSLDADGDTVGRGGEVGGAAVEDEGEEDEGEGSDPTLGADGHDVRFR